MLGLLQLCPESKYGKQWAFVKGVGNADAPVLNQRTSRSQNKRAHDDVEKNQEQDAPKPKVLPTRASKRGRDNNGAQVVEIEVEQEDVQEAESEPQAVGMQPAVDIAPQTDGMSSPAKATDAHTEPAQKAGQSPVFALVNSVSRLVTRSVHQMLASSEAVEQ